MLYSKESPPEFQGIIYPGHTSDSTSTLNTLAFILIRGMVHLMNSSYGMVFLSIIRIQSEKLKVRSVQFLPPSICFLINSIMNSSF